MGLTIHYDLYAPHIHSLANARKLLTPLHAFAKLQGFKSVTKIMTWKAGKDDPILADMFSYYVYDEGDPQDAPIFCAEPLELIFFSIHHNGSESASFGLARHEATAVDTSDGETEKPTGLVGWNWRVGCKTQYAANSNEGGWENFFTIHDGICRMLDEAQRLGMKVKVHDEGKYFENRDAAALKVEIGRWSAMIAAVTGKFKDMAGKSLSEIAASITGDPEFERLEAEGQPFLEMTPEIHVIHAPVKRKKKVPAAKPSKARASKPKAKAKAKTSKLKPPGRGK